MIDPSSSESESEEDQSSQHVGSVSGGGGGGGSGGVRTGSGSSYGSRRQIGPGASLGGASGPVSGSVSSLASPGGSIHGPVGTPRAGTATSQDGTLDASSYTTARSSLSPSMSTAQDAASYAQRPTSPSPSVASEKTEADLQVSIYIFVSFVYTLSFARKIFTFKRDLALRRINKSGKKRKGRLGYSCTCSYRDAFRIRLTPNNHWI